MPQRAGHAEGPSSASRAPAGEAPPADGGVPVALQLLSEGQRAEATSPSVGPQARAPGAAGRALSSEASVCTPGPRPCQLCGDAAAARSPGLTPGQEGGRGLGPHAVAAVSLPLAIPWCSPTGCARCPGPQASHRVTARGTPPPSLPVPVTPRPQEATRCRLGPVHGKVRSAPARRPQPGARSQGSDGAEPVAGGAGLAFCPQWLRAEH